VRGYREGLIHMDSGSFSILPLLGAMCVAEGLVSQAQLDACLKLQALDTQTPIGQILHMQGYISAEALAQMVARQNAFRRVLAQTMELQILSPRLPSAPIPQAVCELAPFVADEIDWSHIFGA
jgi:hypothetical protein